jgi:hypothetical protein
MPKIKMRSQTQDGSKWRNETFNLADMNDQFWVGRRLITQLGSTAAIAVCNPKAVRQLPTH